jgi:hypothetical protein
MKGQYLFLLQQDAFDDKEFVNDLRQFPVHIYLICKAPIIKVNPDNIKIEADTITLEFYIETKGVKEKFEIKTVNRKVEPIAHFKIEFPFTEIEFLKPDGTQHSRQKASVLFRILCGQNNIVTPHLDLEVLYVGQAFGKDGKRITADRLVKHEKAQRIYFDTQQKFPEKEIWFLSMTFIPTLFSMSNLNHFFDPDTFEKGMEHYEKIETTTVSKNQQITITEAGLIRYFNTYQYNKEYLDFPQPEHTSYDECYKLDFNSVSFEFETSSLLTRLWSKDREANIYHIGKFFLHDKADRKNMFEWFKDEKE